MTEEKTLDLSAYLERVHVNDVVSPDAPTLDRLQLAHTTHIPFENIDVQLRRPIRLDVGSLQDKLVTRRRGGYCFEQNTLFAAVLESVGFSVTRLIARVRMSPVFEVGSGGERRVTGARSHMLLVVPLDGVDHLVDVGFGGATPMRPVAMVDDHTVTSGSWTYRVAPSDGGRALQMLAHAGWMDLYVFTDEPQHPIDYEVANHFTSTHPMSPFVQQLIVQRPSADVQLVLRGTELSEFRRDGVSVSTLDGDQLGGVLRKRFGLDVDAELDELAARSAATP